MPSDPTTLDPVSLWKRFLGPLPGRREARVFGILSVLVTTILAILSIEAGLRGQRFMGRVLGGDFAQFHITGSLYNEGRVDEIYDVNEQYRRYIREIPAADTSQFYIFGYAPFTAALLGPIARLPYAAAYVVWMILLFAVTLAALAMLWRAAGILADARATATWLVVGSPIFAFETWIGGQLNVFSLTILSGALLLFSRGAPYRGGLVLSILCFKPTLIAVPAFMLLAGRRWRALLGVCTGVSILGLISFQLAGVEGMKAWLYTLRFFGALVTASEQALRRFKYVDFSSSLRLALPGESWTGIAAAVASLVLLIAVTLAWWRRGPTGEFPATLWSVTIAASLMINIYVPIYDSLLVAAALALYAGARLKTAEPNSDSLIIWLTLFYVVPWVTQSFAEFLRFQPFTILLAAFALSMLRQSHEGMGPISVPVIAPEPSRDAA